MTRYIKDANEFRKAQKEKREMKLYSAAHVDTQPKPLKKRDSEMFEQGIKWFESGLSLEEAKENSKNDSFVSGYNHAKRLRMVREMLFQNGVDFYLKGIPLEDVPDKLKNQEYFILGYEDAKKRGLKK